MVLLSPYTLEKKFSRNLIRRWEGQMGEFREFNYADEQFSDKLFAHFDPHFLPILTLFSQREKIIKFRQNPRN